MEAFYGELQALCADPATVVVLSIIFAGTFVQSTFGFGHALVAMPLLSLLVSIEIAIPLVALVSTTVAATVVARDWRQVQFRSLPLTLFALAGIPIGLFWLREAPESLLKGILAVILIGFACFSLFTPRTLTLSSDFYAPIFGFLAGMLGGAYNTGGPPVVVYGTLRAWSKDQFRATMQAFFVPLGGCVLVGHFLIGLWTPRVLLFYVLSLPVAAIANLLGRWFHAVLSPAKFRHVIYGLVLLLGAMLLVQVVVRML